MELSYSSLNNKQKMEIERRKKKKTNKQVAMLRVTLKYRTTRKQEVLKGDDESPPLE